MSDMVIVSKSEIDKLKVHDVLGEYVVMLEDLHELLSEATTVSGEPVAMINFNESEEYICMPIGREVFKLSPDVDHNLYTIPQPSTKEIEPTIKAKLPNGVLVSNVYEAYQVGIDEAKA